MALEHINKRGHQSIAANWKSVLIEDVDSIHGIALCIDPWGKHMSIPLRVRRAKGALPRPGEMWMVDQSIGGIWTFAQIIIDNPQQIEGYIPRDFRSALGLMGEQGLIQDQTEAVDSYPWMIDIDPIPRASNFGWSTIAVLDVDPPPQPAYGWMFSKNTSDTHAWIEWPIVMGTGHYEFWVASVGSPNTFHFTLNDVTAGLISGADASGGGAFYEGYGAVTVAAPGKYDVRLLAPDAGGSMALLHVRILKTGQLG